MTPPDRPADTGAVGAAAHHRALERLYRSASINRIYPSRLSIPAPGEARIAFEVGHEHDHAAGAVHGAVYFKLLDDAAFYAANSLVTDRFLLTTAFNLHFSRRLGPGPLTAVGRWISGRRRVYVAEARLLDAAGEEAGRGTGTFARSRIALSALPGYASEW